MRKIATVFCSKKSATTLLACFCVPFPQCAFILFCEGGPKQKEDMQNKALPPSFALFPWPNTTKLNVSYNKNPSKN